MIVCKIIRRKTCTYIANTCTYKVTVIKQRRKKRFRVVSGVISAMELESEKSEFFHCFMTLLMTLLFMMY